MRFLLIAFLLLLMACTGEVEGEVQERVIVAVNPEWLVPDSVEEQMWKSDYIVRATLSSAVASTEQVGSEHRPILKHNFTVHEWIKGTGPSSIVVIVRPAYRPGEEDYEIADRTWYKDAETAQQRAYLLLSARNTTWDSVQGILLLVKETKDWYYDWYQMSEVTAQPDTFMFTAFQTSERPSLDHSIASLHRVWLPASGSSDGSTGRGATGFMSEGAEEPSTTLADFRALQKTIETALASDVEGYAECYQRSIRNRHIREQQPIKLAPVQQSINSGTTPELTLSEDSFEASTWIRDGNSDLFRVDGLAVIPIRPLPAGVYTFNRFYQFPAWEVCDYKPDTLPQVWTVTVTAPAGVIEEFLFDPTTIGTAVGQESASEALGGLKWESGKVTVGALPHSTIEVIELDGTVSLSLASTDATQDGTSYRWSVKDQPWANGDKLMVRVTKGPNRARVFEQESYTLSIAENLRAYNIVGFVSAPDPDGDEP